MSILFTNARTVLAIDPFLLKMTRSRPSSDYSKFKQIFNESKNIVVLTGAGISAESGVPTFRGPGGFWRQFKAENLATPQAFERDPSLVWEFYHYRREVMRSKEPNRAHIILAQLEKKLKEEGKGRKITVITQNIDELHHKAGSENVLELHGSLFKVRCTKCNIEKANYDSPICEALRGKGAPDSNAPNAQIPIENLPDCDQCSGLLRPAVVWFGEGLNPKVLSKAEEELEICDICLVVGTSSVVYPAAMFAPNVASRGVPVAEFNMEMTPVTQEFGFHFQGPCGTTLPRAIG